LTNFFNARIYEASTKTSEYLGHEVVATAEKLVKIFINLFCNAIMLLSLKHQKIQKIPGKI